MTDSNPETVKKLQEKVEILEENNRELEKTLEKIIEDLFESFELAMKGVSIPEDKIEEVLGTVDDAVANNVWWGN
jgi:hypothetical protein